MNLVEWFQSVPGHRFVPLFDVDESLVVATKLLGKQKRKILKRGPAMEAAVIDCVERGLQDEKWEGMLYAMGWGTGPTFSPLYIGKAERKGVKNELSENIANIRSNRHMFARWGDGVAYHIGDLSHAMFGFKAYRNPTKKYKRWASVLFDSFDPPKLKKPVILYLAPWLDGSKGPSGLQGSLPAAEKEIIALASVQFAESLLNVDGV